MPLEVFIDRVLTDFFLLLKAPMAAPEMWWIITPLIIVTLTMTFYFGKYVREQLGWNTALGNSIVLFFVCMDLLRTIYHYGYPPTFWQFAWNPINTGIIVVVMAEGILLSYTAFRHALPRQIVFFIASPLPVNLQAYVLTAVVYTRAVPTIYTLYAALLLFIVLLVVLRALQEIEHFKFGYHARKK